MSAVSQPSGTVTLVFTDIEGSTQLLSTLGEAAYREALHEHRRCIREAFVRHGGYEVEHEGDAFFYGFGSASDAVSAAGEASAALERGPVRVRMGIHTGEPSLDPPKYLGLDVHRAARIMAAGHGGQVLVSQATQQLLGDRFPLRDLGDHRLKDLAAPERIYQLGDGTFPPLKTLANTNLPVPATAFLGRERVVADVVELLRDSVRLLTLTGPGGTGKTRLSLAAASEVSGEFGDGVWWVPLAPLRDPSLVVGEVAKTLGVEQEPRRELADTLMSALAGRRMLLLLDNAEHLLPSAAPAIGRLRDAEGIRLLVTSRERLHVGGEQVYAVPALADDEGVRLFVARARELDPTFDDVAAVAELCARLDNLPLAIELAAARSAVISPAQMVERLGARLDLLRGGRDADPRQETLRSTIAWSYDLLEARERELFAGLGVFGDGWTLEAAEQVCGADLDTLGSLVDKSLVRRSSERYWMLETIREYAAERLTESGQEAQLEQRHAEFYERLAEEAEQGLRGPAQGAWLVRLDAEHANVRRAIESSLAGGQPGRALRIAASLFGFRESRGALEGRAWLEQALATGAGTPRERASAAQATSRIEFFQGDIRVARDLLETAVRLARVSGDTDTLARALGWFVFLLAAVGESYDAELRECLALADEVADPWIRADALMGAAAALILHEPARAEAMLQQQLPVWRKLGDELSLADLLNNLGWCAMARGAFDEAERHLRESAAIGRRMNDGIRTWIALGNLGLAAFLAGRYADARELFLDALRLSSARGQVQGAAEATYGLAAAYATAGDAALAVRLHGAYRALTEDKGMWNAHATAVYTPLTDSIRRAVESLDPAVAEALDGSGRAMTADDVLTEAERTAIVS